MNSSKKNILLSITTAVISFLTVIVSLLVFNYFSPFKNKIENNNPTKEKHELVKDALLMKLDSLLSQKEYYRELLDREIAGKEGVSRFGAKAKYLEKIIEDIDIEIEGIVSTNATKKETISNETDENIKPAELIPNVVPNTAPKQNTKIVESSMQNKDTIEKQTIETPQTIKTNDTTEMKINKDTIEFKQDAENQNATQ